MGFVESYHAELEKMNNGKRGRPYRIAESYIRFLAIIRYIFSIGFSLQDSRTFSENTYSQENLDG